MLRKRILVTLILIFIVGLSNAQDSLAFFKSLKYNGVVGLKAFNPYAADMPIMKGAIYFPSILGAEIFSPKIHASIDYRRVSFYSLSARDTNSDIAFSRIHSMIGLTYHFKRKDNTKRPVRIGAAYSIITTKYYFTSRYGFPSRMKGASLFIGIPINWLDIELRADPDQEEILDLDKYSLAFVYRFGSEKKSQFSNANKLNLLLGIHASLNRNYYNPNKGKDIFSPVMLLPEIGLQYEFPESNFSIEARQNLWLGFTAGDTKYDINGNMQHLFFGFSRSMIIKKINLNYGLSHAWIRDIGNRPMIPVTSPGAVEYYPEKGIAFTLSTPIRKINIEGRAIYAYHINRFMNSPVINKFDRYRISVGAIYKFNPQQKSNPM